ncbi:hypothetical protein L0664_13225 [Octadecabacter sp. G9-8]|uniref:Uncharacterized protein n=1 Tax=Octadecabacter dasysiphoniae TaxID=2909341 RepID=A0ABS9CXM8_9RHOB|nr:hypothetical protein [Octadecabacter dasysiphoniae]MCF2872030.1 hypothetical protein [Octadecabacter dasysiphoniae]
MTSNPIEPAPTDPEPRHSLPPRAEIFQLFEETGGEMETELEALLTRRAAQTAKPTK